MNLLNIIKEKIDKMFSIENNPIFIVEPINKTLLKSFNVERFSELYKLHTANPFSLKLLTFLINNMDRNNMFYYKGDLYEYLFKELKKSKYKLKKAIKLLVNRKFIRVAENYIYIYVDINNTI